METIQILSSRLREEELEIERLRRERDVESEKALRAVETPVWPARALSSIVSNSKKRGRPRATE